MTLFTFEKFLKPAVDGFLINEVEQYVLLLNCTINGKHEKPDDSKMDDYINPIKDAKPVTKSFTFYFAFLMPSFEIDSSPKMRTSAFATVLSCRPHQCICFNHQDDCPMKSPSKHPEAEVPKSPATPEAEEDGPKAAKIIAVSN